MCGLAAIFRYRTTDAPVDVPELLRIRDAMRHRGPDGEGLWVSEDQRIALAHRRLAILDLTEAGAQPMALDDGRLRVVFNGEIYNHRELRRQLEAEGCHFRSRSDTEVLLHLYGKYGHEMVQHLRGMYAFALWDDSRKGLFLARDPFGIKPLYLADDGGCLRVASQVKALLKGGAIDAEPDPAGHVGFYLWGHVPEPYTLHKQIRALPAGTSLWIDANGRKEYRTFFSLTRELAQGAETQIVLSREEMHERLRTALHDSVQHHLIADVPVGIFLSSGIDSTVLTALVREIVDCRSGESLGPLTPDIHTITLGFREFQGTSADEVPLAEQVARRYRTTQHTCWVTRKDFEQEFQNLLEVMDQPSIDGVNTYFVSKAAKESGLKVALSGMGGDELLGGYSSFRQIPRLVQFLKPFRHLPGLAKTIRALTAPIFRSFTSPKYAGLLEFGGSYGGAYLLRRGLFMPWEIGGELDEDIVRAGWTELQTLNRLEETVRGIHSESLRVTALESSWYLRNQLLRDADWASMAHSVEIRTPLVDLDLFRAVLPMFSAGQAPGKQVMASMPGTPLPDSVHRRLKTGFSIPVRTWLAQKDRSVARHRGLRAWALRLTKPARPRKVLVLVTDGFGDRGGIAKFNRDLLRALSGDPAIVRVIAIPRLMTGPAGILPEKLEYVTRGLGGKARYIMTVLATLWRNRDVDLVICGHLNLLPIAVLSRMISRSPLVQILHGIEAWKPSASRLVNFLVRKVDGIVAVSDYTRQRFDSWAQVEAARNWLLPNCFDQAAIQPRNKSPALLKRYGLEGKKVIVTCGRLASQERYKGFDEVINLLPQLVQEIPGIAYLIIGDGNDMERLKAKAQRLGVGEKIVFAGYVPENEKYDHYCLGDAFVMPSRGEGFGIVFLEAMACGLPVVGSKVDGGRDALRNGQLGILVDPGDPEDIKHGIHEALKRERKIPKDLEYFSPDNFNRRVRNIVAAFQ